MTAEIGRAAGYWCRLQHLGGARRALPLVIVCRLAEGAGVVAGSVAET